MKLKNTSGQYKLYKELSMINVGNWKSILKFLEESNNKGKQLICECSHCTGTYTHDRAYINEDGDFVLSKNTLTSLLEEVAYNALLEFSSDPKKNTNRYFALSEKLNEEEIYKNLIKREYED